MAKIGCGLPRFLTQHHGLWVNEPKRIDDHLPFHTLNGVDHNSNRPLIELLKTLQGSKTTLVTQPSRTTLVRPLVATVS